MLSLAKREHFFLHLENYFIAIEYFSRNKNMLNQICLMTCALHFRHLP